TKPATRIISPNGRWVQLAYDSNRHVVSATDNARRRVGYAYDAFGRLTSVTDAAGGVTRYSWPSCTSPLTVECTRVVSVVDPRGTTALANEYDTAGRLAKQTLANGGSYQFGYTLTGGAVTKTTVTDPRGTRREVSFDAKSFVVKDIRAAGTARAQTHTYAWDPSTHFLTKEVDALGRATTYAHDQAGNVTRVTRLAGTPDAVSTSFTYEPAFNQVTKVEDPLHHVAS